MDVHIHIHGEAQCNEKRRSWGFGDFSYKKNQPSASAASAPAATVYMLCQSPYVPMNADTLNYGCGNLVVERIDSEGNPAGDYYFKERGSGKILCWRGFWLRREDTNHSGCFFFLNGNIATFNPEEPDADYNGVTEFRVSRIGNA